MASPRFHGSFHSSASAYTPSTQSMASSDDTGGCSRDWPARNRDADGVSTTRMLRTSSGLVVSGCRRRKSAASFSMIRGSLMVATDPLGEG